MSNVDVDTQIFAKLSDAERAHLLAQLATRPLPGSQSLTTYNLTDSGNAERLIAMHGDLIRYVADWQTWLFWDGLNWQAEGSAANMMQRAKSTVRQLYMDAGQLIDDNERKAAAKWAMASESRNRQEALIALAQSDPTIAIQSKELNANPLLLTAANGTINLRTGQLQDTNPGDHITRRTSIAYDAAADCPTWLDFLNVVFAGDAETVNYLQRAVGYSLTGSTAEQCLFYLYGHGRNGKTTFLNVLSALLGGNYERLNTEALMQHTGRTPNDIARLAGARLAVAVETDAGRRLNESLIKELLGNDDISARFMFKEFFTFRPIFKLWIAGNHKAGIRGTDDGIWRRIRLIHFAVQIPVDQVDKRLPDKLAAELPGILAWAVRGCLDWQAHGLGSSTAVDQATKEYRTDEDTLAAFLDEATTRAAGETVLSKDIYNAYCMWAKDNGERAASGHLFGRMLTERGFEKRRTAAARSWEGLTLSPDGEDLKGRWLVATP